MVPVFLVCFGVCVVYMGQLPEIKLMYVCITVYKIDCGPLGCLRSRDCTTSIFIYRLWYVCMYIGA